MKRRTAAWFVAEVKRRAKQYDPAMPMRFNITADERPAVEAAIDALPDGWSCVTCSITHPEATKQGAIRATFLGPQYQAPKPVEVVEVKPTKGESLETAFVRTAAGLRKKYGWQFHVPNSRKVIYHPSPRAVVEVWNPADWLQAEHPAFSLVELAELVRANVREVRLTGPLTAKGAALEQRGRDHAREMNASKSARAARLHAYIREQYKSLMPELRAGTLRVKEAYDEIQKKVAAQFHDDASDDHDLHVSYSTIDRALGKKGSKRTKS